MPTANARRDRKLTPNAEQLHRECDDGISADKLRAGGPATTPLGSASGEVAGKPATPSRIARAVLNEISADIPDEGRGPGAAWIIVAAVLVLVLAGGLAWHFAT
jgi:hypothetical protein